MCCGRGGGGPLYPGAEPESGKGARPLVVAVHLHHAVAVTFMAFFCLSVFFHLPQGDLEGGRAGEGAGGEEGG